jgi:hypothetical protein
MHKQLESTSWGGLPTPCCLASAAFGPRLLSIHRLPHLLCNKLVTHTLVRWSGCTVSAVALCSICSSQITPHRMSP